MTTLNPALKFGTDGWRAIIADAFTFDNLSLVARGTAQWLMRRYGPGPSVVIGYDTRFLGRPFAERTAQVMATMGVRVTLSETFTSTPAVSWAARAYGASAGIAITASHNPPEYSGFKIKTHFGGPASPAMIAEVEEEIARVEGGLDLRPLADLREQRLVVLRDLTSDYLDALRERLDVEAIRSANLRIAYDAMFGAGQGMVTRLLGERGVIELHGDFNPGFHGQAPEPIERNLKELAATILREKCDVGLATDGDADRIGMYDEEGQFVDSHRLLALLVKYLHTEKGLQGDVVKTFSTTDMLDRMGERYGLRVHTTPIGFKYIGPMLVEGDVLVGGEESGGIAVKGHMPERDGVFIGLLVVEMMVRRGRKLSELVRELLDEFGEHHYHRADLHTTEASKRAFLNRLQAEGLSEVAGRPVLAAETLDGYKFLTDDGWLLVRPSGTEPVLRIYAESSSRERSEAMVRAIEALVG